MRLNLRQARALCTVREFDLVASSFGERLEAASVARLKSKIARARALRDKYRDLLRRQRLARRERLGSKAPAAGRVHARTAEKAALFEQTLRRLTARLAQLQSAARREAAKKAARKTAGERAAKVSKPARSPKAPAVVTPLVRKVLPPAVRGFVSDKAAQAARRLRLQSMGAKSVQAHVSARGRRRQARRDTRQR